MSLKLKDIIAETADQSADTNNNAEQTLEIEYSFFAKVDVAALLTEFNADKEVTCEHFIEGNITSDPRVGKLRVRHFPNSKSMPVTKLEMKTKVALNQAIETSTDVPEAFLKPLLSKCDNVTARLRYYVPVKRPDGTVLKRRDQTLLMWQVDFFINNIGAEDQVTADAISEWVKIEVEVDHDALTAQQVSNNIPFEYQGLVDARTKDDSERNLIDTLYSTVYNLSGRGTYPEHREPEKLAEKPQQEPDDEHDFHAHMENERASKPAAPTTPATEPAAPATDVPPSDSGDENEDFEASLKNDAVKPAEPTTAQADQPPSGDDEFNFNG